VIMKYDELLKRVTRRRQLAKDFEQRAHTFLGQLQLHLAKRLNCGENYLSLAQIRDFQQEGELLASAVSLITEDGLKVYFTLKIFNDATHMIPVTIVPLRHTDLGVQALGDTYQEGQLDGWADAMVEEFVEMTDEQETRLKLGALLDDQP
jgi:hypothetical protein